ncbi:MAG: 1-acyl-sn-glycerol-3-phosphate acyltransferase [Gammaproteobacteria bacterium AqS3]|nr:1-acyl-sn-glycerol-3-phosphate acyltransferase [Gammaproteobacteria bacterium AqS3]
MLLRYVLSISQTQNLDPIAEAAADPNTEVVYALSDARQRSIAALDQLARDKDLPLPYSPLKYEGGQAERLLRWGDASWSECIAQLTQAAENNEKRLLIAPVQVLWGDLLPQGAAGVRSFWSRLQHTLGSRSNVQIEISEAVEVRPGENTLSLASRIEEQIRTLEEGRLGPLPPAPGQMVTELLESPAVSAIINAEGKGEKTLKRLRTQAQRYAKGMVADMRHSTLHLISNIVGRFMHRIYESMEGFNFDSLKQISGRSRVIYAPSHRSHMDYLLLGYNLIQNHYPSPHIMAGDNLNMPIVGGILRRGGAVFMRRSFAGNRLYLTIFETYISRLLRGGFPLEYFVEGGRSRTGRLLRPKLGLLRSTLDFSHTNPDEEVTIVPVNIVYDRLFELSSYQQELTGLRKRQESIADVIRTLRNIRQNHGRAYVIIGDAIPVRDYLPKEWDHHTSKAAAQSLGSQIMKNINAVAVATPVALLASVLLGSPRLIVDPETMHEQLEFLLAYITESSDIHVVEKDPERIVECGVSCGIIELTQEGYITVPPAQAPMLAYYRNNLGHLCAVAGAIAMVVGQSAKRSQVTSALKLFYPYLHAEYTMTSELKDGAKIVKEQIELMQRIGLLNINGDVIEHAPGATLLSRADLLTRSASPVLERLYILTAVLMQDPQPARRLAKTAGNIAQRVNRLINVHSPEYYETSVFHGMIQDGIHHGAFRHEGELELRPGEHSKKLFKILHEMLPIEFTRCVSRLITRDLEAKAEEEKTQKQEEEKAS